MRLLQAKETPGESAGSLLAVAAARALYSLPYFHATFSVSRRRARIVYSSRRHQGAASAEFRAE